MRFYKLICLALFFSFMLFSGADAQDMKKAPHDTIFGQGEVNPYSQFFSGQTYLTMLSHKDDIWNSSIGNVTFEPGARTNWHKHSGGQILLVLADRKSTRLNSSH